MGLQTLGRRKSSLPGGEPGRVDQSINMARGRASGTREAAGRRQRIIGVAGELDDVVEDLAHDALTIDHEGDALDALDEGRGHAKQIDDLPVGVLQERDAFVSSEVTGGLLIVGRDAEDLDAERLELRCEGAKLRRFSVSPIGEGLGEEEHDYGLAFEVAEVHGAAVCGPGRE